jgi:hypothetical protein
MKTYRRSSLPDFIEYNGKRYVLDASASSVDQPEDGSIRVIVTNPKLRGIKDLHGNPYPSTTFYFLPDGEKQKRRVAFWVHCFMPRTQQWCRQKLANLKNGSDPTIKTETSEETQAKIAALNSVLGR